MRIFQRHLPHLTESLRKHFYITYIPICTSRPKYKGLVEKLQRLSTASDLLGPQRDNSYSGFLCPAAGLPMVKVPLFSQGKLNWTFAFSQMLRIFPPIENLLKRVIIKDYIVNYTVEMSPLVILTLVFIFIFIFPHSSKVKITKI